MAYGLTLDQLPRARTTRTLHTTYRAMARSVLAMTGMALTVVLATVLTVLNGSESEAAFGWGRQLSYLAISAALLAALAWVGVGRRATSQSAALSRGCASAHSMACRSYLICLAPC
jgi:FtsH-binding integral membrane protein